jgi:Family of unknown function (DUF5719)
MRARYRRPLFAVLVLVVLGGIYAGAEAGHPGTAAGRSSASAASAPIASAVRVCAAPGSSGVTAASVALAAVPGAASTGKAVVTRLTPAGSASAGPVVATVSHPGVLAVAPVKTAAPLPKSLQAGQPGSSRGVTTQAGRGGVVVSATGAMAQGLEVEQTGPGGLVTAQCGSPSNSFWFAGPGQATAADIELYLMNTGSQAADAEVSFLTDVTKGAPLLGNSDNGITVPPHSMVVQSLGKLLLSSRYVALNVSTSVGQVVAAVRESSGASHGGAWLPATATPTRALVIPGMPASSGPRELYIAVPGSAAAQVKITAVTSRGSYQPTGGTGLDLLGDSINEVPLPSLEGVPGALKISSNVPVTASMVVPGGPAGTSGVVAAAAGPVQSQGVVADNPANSGGSVELVISAPGSAATVRITEATGSVPASGQAGRMVHVKARSSVVLPIKPPSGGKSQFAVIVTPLPGSGPVYAARLISTSGTLRSILPVPTSPTSVQMAPVLNSLSNIAN